MANKINVNWIKARVGDELGLSADDLTRLYGIDANALDKQLTTLGSDNQTVYERVLSDVDAVRVGYRQIQVSDDQIADIRKLLSTYPFHPLVGVQTADAQSAWRLSGDDAQFVAFRAADAVGIDFDCGEVLRLRLNRLVIWPDAPQP